MTIDEIYSGIEPFFDWLSAQAERDDPVGDLAKDTQRDPLLPTDGDLEAVREYFSSKGSHVEDAFAGAWREFQHR